MTTFTTNPTSPPPPLPNPGPPPPSKSGHLPIDPGPRAGFVPQDAVARESAPGAGAGPTTLAQLVSDLRLMLAAALARTQHQWDPASGPQQEDAPIGPAYVDRKVMNARADIRAALAELDELRVVVSLHDPERPTVPRPMPGFVLPQPKPWQWPGTTALARQVYNATRSTGPAWPSP